jgi:predicted ArsR family transcriptional regulator
MAEKRWTERLFGTTRGRVIALLRGRRQTVNELADALRLTDNAVRSHLLALERDALVEQVGVQRGVGKPAFVYALTADAEGLFPRAYGLVLRTLLDTLRLRLPADVLAQVVRDTGRALAGDAPRAGGSLEERAEAAVAVLAGIGGVAEIRAEGGAVTVVGVGCPLAEAVAGHPEVCQLAAALLEQVVGLPVRESCDRAGSPSCRFHLAEAVDATG